MLSVNSRKGTCQLTVCLCVWLWWFWGCGWAPSELRAGGQCALGSPLGCVWSSPVCSRYWKPEAEKSRQETFPASAATFELPTQNKAFYPAWVIWFAALCSRHASVNRLIVKWRQWRLPELCCYEGQKCVPIISMFVCVTEPVRHHSAFVWQRLSAPSLPLILINKQRSGCSGSCYIRQMRRKIGQAQKTNCTANVQLFTFKSNIADSRQRNGTFIFIGSEGTAARRI